MFGHAHNSSHGQVVAHARATTLPWELALTHWPDSLSKPKAVHPTSEEGKKEEKRRGRVVEKL